MHNIIDKTNIQTCMLLQNLQFLNFALFLIKKDEVTLKKMFYASFPNLERTLS